MPRILLPVGSEIEVFDPEERPYGAMPIYEGDVEGAHMSLEYGVYPFTFTFDEYFAATEGLPHNMGPVQCLLIVAPGGESFAVTTDAPALDAVWSIVPS